MIYDNVSETIGRTPVVRIHRLGPSNLPLYGKLGAPNPGGSVKDRLALGIIEDAERSGELKPGQTVVEATSGNTGIALAMICAARGYPFVALMPESFSVERRQVMRAYGAKVVLTPAAERASGAVRMADKLAAERGWFLARQFDNPANPAFHRQTTGPEILSDFASLRLDYWVTGWGTHTSAPAPTPRSSPASPPMPPSSAATNGSPTRSRAGLPTSSPPSSTAASSTRSSPSPTPRPSPPHATSPTKRASSAASPRAPPSQALSPSPPRPPPAASSSPCSPTPASATSPPSSSKASTPA